MLDRPGTWSFRADWTGRGIGSLRLEEPGGRVVGRIAGASPLELRVPVPPGGGPRRLRVHFSSLGARGVLRGKLAVTPPPAEQGGASRGPGKPAPAGDAPAGPGACLLAGNSGTGEGPVDRRVRLLASTLERASPEGVAWARKWVGRGVAAALAPGDRRREEFDALWEGLRLDPAPDRRLGRAVRGVVAELEDLVRREGDRKGAGARQAEDRKRALAGVLSCLAPVDRRP